MSPKLELTPSEKLSSLINHIKLVETNCNIISRKMASTDMQFAIDIAKRGRIHDASKFDKLEFEHLWEDSEFFDFALTHHRLYNTHHPEYYKDGIYGMSELDIAEMVADCTARSQEFVTGIRSWFFDGDEAPSKYGYIGDKAIYDKIEFYLNMIVKTPFKKRKKIN